MKFFEMPSFVPDERGKLAQLWVTSVAGTALVIVIQSFGTDWPAWRFVPLAADWSFTLDRWIRYALAAWFGIYMVLAYLANEARPNWTRAGLFFDVAQSVLVFVALGLLGFVTQKFERFADDFEWPLTAAFGTICFIALWTFISHIKPGEGVAIQKWKKFQVPLQWVRGYVAFVSAVAVVYVWCHEGQDSDIGDVSGLRWVFILSLASLAGLYLYAVNAFHKDSFRHVPDDVNEVHLEAAAATLTKAGEALESAGKSLKSLQVKPAGKA